MGGVSGTSHVIEGPPACSDRDVVRSDDGAAAGLVVGSAHRVSDDGGEVGGVQLVVGVGLGLGALVVVEGVAADRPGGAAVVADSRGALAGAAALAVVEDGATGDA